MNIADRIQILRKSKGISQEELADKIGVSRQAVSKWESEQSTPDIEKIILLSDYFQTTTDYILKGIEPVKEYDKKLNAIIFSIIGTGLNVIGLVFSIFYLIERQTFYATGIGIAAMVLGICIFLIGQFTDTNNKIKAKYFFILTNIWILLFIPLSCIFNIVDGLVYGYFGLIAPIPLIGNSILTYLFYWTVYILICIISDIYIFKKYKISKNKDSL